MWIALFLCFISFACGCSKSDGTASRDVPPTSSVAATVPAPAPVPVATAVTTPNRPTAAERIVVIDRLLARSLTGTPESADERTLLRAERAAFLSSGQVPSQPGNQVPAQPVPTNPPPMGQHSTTDAPSGQIVIATSSSSLPFLEQMTPSERDHYFQELWLQNSSLVNVNVNRGGLGFGRIGTNRGRANPRPPRSRSATRPK